MARNANIWNHENVAVNAFKKPAQLPKKQTKTVPLEEDFTKKTHDQIKRALSDSENTSSYSNGSAYNVSMESIATPLDEGSEQMSPGADADFSDAVKNALGIDTANASNVDE